MGESGGKISLGTVPVSPPTVPPTTDPQSFTILPYANWLDGGAKGTQTFSVRVSEVTALDSFLTGIPLVGLVAAPVINLLQTLPLIGDLLAPIIGASVVARINVDVASLAPSDTPVALTYMVTSFDGVGISTNFFPAAGLSAGATAPTAISMAGLGGGAYSDPYTDRVFDIEGSEYDVPSVGVLRNNGYNVVSATPRGVRNSGGIMQLDNPFFEGRDMSAVIDFIATDTPATLDSPNDPAVGMVGTSYGGGIQLVAAGIDPRIDAITPENTWNSLNSSLYPDNTWKTSYGSVLYLVLVVTGARVNSLVPRAVLTGNLFGRISETAQAALASSGPTALLNTVQAPTLLTQGIQEALFPLRQTLDNAEAILGNGFGTTVKVAWFCGGHGVCLDPVNPDQEAMLVADTLDWLAQYVKRTGTPADDIPNFQWFDQLGGYYFSDTLPNQFGFNNRPDITATSAGGLLPVVPLLGGSNSFFALPFSLGGGSVARNAINVPVTVGAGTQVVGAPAVSITYQGLGTTPGGVRASRRRQHRLGTRQCRHSGAGDIGRQATHADHGPVGHRLHQRKHRLAHADRADHQFGHGIRELHLVRADEYLGCQRDDAKPHGLEQHPGDHLGHRGRLVHAVDLDGVPHGQVDGAVVLRNGVGQLRAHPDAAVHRHGRQKPHLVEPVVDDKFGVLDAEVVLAQCGNQREREESVRDRSAVGTLGLGAGDIDVDPLVVAGDIGEIVDALLVDIHPVADAEFGADRRYRIVDGGDELHGVPPSGPLSWLDRHRLTPRRQL